MAGIGLLNGVHGQRADRVGQSGKLGAGDGRHVESGDRVKKRCALEARKLGGQSASAHGAAPEDAKRAEQTDKAESVTF